MFFILFELVKKIVDVYMVKVGEVKVALIGPSFFSYVQSIRDEFVRRGLKSDYFDERHSNTIFSKICYRFGLSFLYSKKKSEYFDALISRLIAGAYTDVLLVDVEVVDKPFVASLVQNGMKVHIYMWDSSHNKSGFLKFISLLSGKGSFEPEDCAKYGMSYIPLFAEDVFASALLPANCRKFDFSFCGTLHSNRGYFVNELRKFCVSMGLTFEEWLFFHSKWLFGVTCIFRPVNLRSFFKVSEKGFSKTDVAKLFAESKYVLDIPHSGQRGLTARTFEVLRAGSCLVTSNQGADDLPLELASRILVFDEIKNIDYAELQKLEGGPISASTDYYLSIGRFVDQLVEIMGVGERYLISNNVLDDKY